jgi:nucleoid-associated protein YejK
MQVNRLVIHQLEKDAQTRGIKLYNSSSSLMAVTEGINKMYIAIHESFENDKTRHCKYRLEEDANTVLNNTNHYLSSEDDDTFLRYTKASLDNLAVRIENVIFATGGYYLFADYTYNSKRYMSIILARKKDGFHVKFNDASSTFNFTSTENINTDKLAMGYRVNLNLYLNQEEFPDRNYMALLTLQGDRMSDYFLEWVNASDAVNGKIQTGILISAIKHLGPENGEDVADFQNRIFGLINDFRKGNGGSLNIDSLSEAIYGDRRKIRNYIEIELEKEIDPDIRPDAASLKKLIQIRAEVSGISLTINASKFGDEVSVDGDALIIRNPYLISQINRQRYENG